MNEFFGSANDADRGAAQALVEGLNEPQKLAVTSRDRALLVIAGAGSGKTRVLTHRIAHLLATKDAWPSQILAITFTNKAAGEMQERVRQLLGSDSRSMWIGTFHSVCVRILRREIRHLGYRPEITIYDSADSKALLKKLIKKHSADLYDITPQMAASAVSRFKNSRFDKQLRVSAKTDAVYEVLMQIYRDYEDSLRAANALDFDDLLLKTVILFQEFPAVAAQYQRRFRHILVDEYQDTNPAQYQLIRELTKPVDAELVRECALSVSEPDRLPDGGIAPASLTVVGDSDQSIYAFRGANIQNILQFEQHFQAAKVVKLEQNYRSTQNVLAAANAIISANPDRPEKNLWSALGAGDKIVGFAGHSQDNEANFVAQEIQQLHADGVKYSDIAVFYRVNAQTRALEDQLMHEAVPYKVVGGTKFYDRAEIRDILAYLITIANPQEPLAWSRVMLMQKGIGEGKEAQIAQLQFAEQISFHEAMIRANETKISKSDAQRICALGEFLAQLNTESEAGDEGEKMTVSSLLEAVIEETQYIAQLRKKNNPQDEARAENVEEFLALAKNYDTKNPGAGLQEFLAEVSLVAAADDLEDDSGKVSLMTLHTAKGLEYPVVFLTGVEEGMLPHSMALSEGSVAGVEEERRLMYVGVTRARQRLYLTLAATRAQYGKTVASKPSQFIADIPQELIEWRREYKDVKPDFYEGRFSQNRGGFTHGGSKNSAMSDAMQQWRARKALAAKKQESGGEFASFVTAQQLRDRGQLLELQPGDTVTHPKFGAGTVEQVEGAGVKAKAQINFQTVGVKKLAVSLAPLKKL